MIDFLHEAQLTRLAYKGYDPRKKETNKQKLEKRVLDYTKRGTVAIVELNGLLCYILKCADKDYIVFRGTNSLQNWIENNFNLSKIEVTEGKVQQGMYNGAVTLTDQLVKYIDGSKPLVLAGHSLGADMALISAKLLCNAGLDIEHVTAFEPANFANKKYIKNTNDLFKKYIFKNNIDLVTTSMMQLIKFYQYQETILYFNRANELLLNPTKLEVGIDKTMTYINPKNLIGLVEDHSMTYMLNRIIDNEKYIAEFQKKGLI